MALSGLSASGVSTPDFSRIQQRLNQRLDNAVKAGTVSAAAATQFSQDLGALKVSGSTGGTTAASGPPDFASIRSQIQGLLDADVKSGKISADQASAIQETLKPRSGGTGGSQEVQGAAAQPSDGSQAASGVAGTSHAGGHRGHRPDGDRDDASGAQSTTTSANAAGQPSSGSNSILDFLKQLIDAMSAGGSANGTSTTSSATSTSTSAASATDATSLASALNSSIQQGSNTRFTANLVNFLA
jgi:polyhydroxyalkanoate synthesis regulator phasin